MIPALPGSVGFKQTSSKFRSVKFSPQSVDLYNPSGGRPGGRNTTPRETERTPGTPRAEETYMIFALPGSITIEEMERPSNAGPVYAGAFRTPNVPGGTPNTASQSTPGPVGTLVFEAR